MIEALYLEKLYANPADGHSLVLGILGKPDPFNASWDSHKRFCMPCVDGDFA